MDWLNRQQEVWFCLEQAARDEHSAHAGTPKQTTFARLYTQTPEPLPEPRKNLFAQWFQPTLTSAQEE